MSRFIDEHIPLPNPQYSASFEHHLELNEASDDPAGILAAATSLSKQQIKQAMQKGAVWSGRGKKVTLLRRNHPLTAGTGLHLYYNPKVLAEQPPTPVLIADRESYSIWCKPYGMYSQGSKWGDHCTIARWAGLHLERPSFIVHRLDRATSGLIIVAHGKTMAAKLAELFSLREICKRYLAICEGELNDPVTVKLDIDDKSACSHFQALASNPQQSLICVDIETGRKHQIRRHLAAIDHPIIGDRLHGHAKAGDIDLQLVAFHLDFICPATQQPINITLSLEQMPVSFSAYAEAIALI